MLLQLLLWLWLLLSLLLGLLLLGSAPGLVVEQPPGTGGGHVVWRRGGWHTRCWVEYLKCVSLWNGRAFLEIVL